MFPRVQENITTRGRVELKTARPPDGRRLENRKGSDGILSGDIDEAPRPAALVQVIWLYNARKIFGENGPHDKEGKRPIETTGHSAQRTT